MCRSVKSKPADPLLKIKSKLCFALALPPIPLPGHKYVKWHWHETNSSIHKCLRLGWFQQPFYSSYAPKDCQSGVTDQVFGLDGLSQTRFRLLSRITFFSLCLSLPTDNWWYQSRRRLFIIFIDHSHMFICLFVFQCEVTSKSLL